MNKKGFDCALCALSFCSFSSFPSSIPLFISSILPRLLTVFFFFFFLVPLQVSNHLPFPYLSVTSLSSTPLHYEVQLRITPGKFIYIFLDPFTFQKNYITISFLVCLMHVSLSTKTCIAFLYHWLPSEQKGEIIYVSSSRFNLL